MAVRSLSAENAQDRELRYCIITEGRSDHGGGCHGGDAVASRLGTFWIQNRDARRGTDGSEDITDE